MKKRNSLKQRNKHQSPTESEFIGKDQPTEGTESSFDKNWKNIKPNTHDQRSENSSCSINEEDHYEKLLFLMRELESIDLESSQENLLTHLEDFRTSELLFQSEAPLWKDTKDAKLMKQYFRTISALVPSSYEINYLETKLERFLAIKHLENPENLLLLEADSVAINCWPHRRKFLDEVEKICKKECSNRVSELSKEIIFLHREYKERRKQILRWFEEERKDGADMGRSEEKIKVLMRELKKAKARKMTR